MQRFSDKKHYFFGFGDGDGFWHQLAEYDVKQRNERK